MATKNACGASWSSNADSASSEPAKDAMTCAASIRIASSSGLDVLLWGSRNAEHACGGLRQATKLERHKHNGS